MQKRDDIERRVEETLNSLEGMHRAKANPFIFTRIQSRLHQSKGFLDRLANLTAKPAFAIIILCIVLITNAMVMIRETANTSATSVESTQFAVIDEYAQNELSLYDDENPEP